MFYGKQYQTIQHVIDSFIQWWLFKKMLKMSQTWIHILQGASGDGRACFILRHSH